MKSYLGGGGIKFWIRIGVIIIFKMNDVLGFLYLNENFVDYQRGKK